MRIFRSSFQLIRENLRVYLVLSALGYVAYLAGTGGALLLPDLHAAYSTTQDQGGDTAQVVELLRNPLLFSAMILFVNLSRIVLLRILLPSFVVPFLGIPIFLYWAFETGVVLAPVDHASTMTMIPHSVTVVIEFQAYALMLLGAYLLGRAVLKPATVEAPNRFRAYLRGLRQIARLLPVTLLLFVIGALYEALTLVYLVPHLIN